MRGVGGVRILDGDPAYGEPLAQVLAPERVQVRHAAHGEDLEAAALRQVARSPGDEPVEAGAGSRGVVLLPPNVLGLVDDAGPRIYGDGLVHHPPHGPERDGVHGVGRGDRHLEDIAVGLLEAEFGSARRLLAGEPAPPGRPSAGAVDVRAAQRDVLRGHADIHVRAGAGDLHFERRRAAARPRVVRPRPQRLRACGRVRHLVVPDQAYARDPRTGFRFQRERGHAVHRVGHDEIGIRDGSGPGPAQRLHAESGGDPQLGAVRALDELAVAAVPPAPQRRRRGGVQPAPGRERFQGRTQEGRAADGGGAAEEDSAVDRHRVRDG